MAWVTYNPEKGDDRVVEYLGIEIFAGQPVEVDDAYALAKLENNRWFEVSEDKPSRRGRPPKDDGSASEEG